MENRNSIISTRDLATALGVSESSIKRWSDEGQLTVARTRGGHRRIALTEAIRFIRASGLPVADPRPLRVTGLSAEELTPVSDGERALAEALMADRAPAARALVMSQFLAGTPVSVICDDTLAPAMRRVGELWQHDAAGIGIEHRATDICLQTLYQLRSLLPVSAGTAAVATGGAPAGDVYTLPSLMAATTLGDTGWMALNLGGNTPLSALRAVVQRSEARLVWLALSNRDHQIVQVAALRKLAEWLGQRDIALVVGGRGWPSGESAGHGNVYLAQSMRELAAYAHGLAGRLTPSAAANEDARTPPRGRKS